MLKTVTAPDEDPKRELDDTPQPHGQGSAAAPATERHILSMQFTSSPRGARLARRTAVRHLDQWGFPPMSDASCTIALLVAELTANAVRHGRVPGRDFLLNLVYEARASLFRVEVSDACPDRPLADPMAPADEEESGRGLFLVDILASRWGSVPRTPVGKTVWAECRASTTGTVVGSTIS